MILLPSVAAVILSLGSLAGAPPAAAYHLTGTIAVGGEGGWDYLAADAGAHRLYVSHATRVVVLDTETGQTVGEVPDTPGVHGIALAPDLGRGYTSDGRSGTVTVFEVRDLRVLARVKVTGENPDAIVYEPTTRRVFTFNGRSGNATAIDAAKLEVVGTLALDGKPEFAVADGRGTVFVNLEDRGAILAFDARSLEVRGRWPLAPCEEPTGLAIDRKNRRLFAGCHNRLMAVMDADSGRVVTTLPIGAGVDGIAFDPGSGLAFSSNGEGTLTVVREESPERFTLMGNVPTKRGARTLALDEVTHRIYLSTARFGPPASPTPEQPHPRPSIVPGTFEVLIVAP